jgi:enoyl-CoA hydratase/carnithine racemase
MSDSELLYDVGDGVARVTINRPERRNALSWPVVSEIRAALAAAKDDPVVRVVVLAGGGDKAFCAGADLDTMSGQGWSELHASRGQIAALFEDLWSLGKPTIARVQGFALAGGFGLALACDMVICSADAVFGTPEINIGLWPYMITVPIVRAMPPKRALELMLTGRRVGAEEAERIGFVNRVVPAQDLDAAVAELAAGLAARSPTAMKLGRDSFYRAIDMASGDALAYLHTMLTVTVATDDAEEGLAAFAGKRPPQWTGR